MGANSRWMRLIKPLPRKPSAATAPRRSNAPSCRSVGSASVWRSDRSRANSSHTRAWSAHQGSRLSSYWEISVSRHETHEAGPMLSASSGLLPQVTRVCIWDTTLSAQAGFLVSAVGWMVATIPQSSQKKGRPHAVLVVRSGRTRWRGCSPARRANSASCSTRRARSSSSRVAVAKVCRSGAIPARTRHSRNGWPAGMGSGRTTTKRLNRMDPHRRSHRFRSSGTDSPASAQ